MSVIIFVDHALIVIQHSYIANGLGGKDGVIVIDMQNFQSVTVDDSAGTAVIQAGNRLGDIVTALAAHGRGLPHGTCLYVGFGGHAGACCVTGASQSFVRES